MDWDLVWGAGGVVLSFLIIFIIVSVLNAFAKGMSR